MPFPEGWPQKNLDISKHAAKRRGYMSAYLITRDGQELGSFDVSQIQDGLKSGQFQSSDWAWREGMAEWKPLSSVVAMPSAAPGPALAPLDAASRPAAAALSKPPVTAPRPNAISSPPSVGAKPGAINPYASPSASPGVIGSPTAAGAVPPAVVAELTGTKPWVRLISVLMWIGCVFVLLGLVGNMIMIIGGVGTLAGKNMAAGGIAGVAAFAAFGSLTALLVLYPTLKLTKYASNISRLADSKSFTDLAAALREQRRFWKFYGILIIIYLCVILGFVLLVAAGAGMSIMSKGMVQP